MNEFKIRDANKNDAQFLSTISTSTFFDTYVAINPENAKMLAAYVKETFNEDKIERALNDRNVRFYILENKIDKIGYAKTVTGQGPVELNYSPSLEIEKLYLLQKFQGKNLGMKLFNHIKESANLKGHKSLWLSVYDQNTSAINFYTKAGFKVVGEKEFIFSWGKEKYKDRDLLLEYFLVPST